MRRGENEIKRQNFSKKEITKIWWLVGFGCTGRIALKLTEIPNLASNDINRKGSHEIELWKHFENWKSKCKILLIRFLSGSLPTLLLFLT